MNTREVFEDVVRQAFENYPDYQMFTEVVVLNGEEMEIEFHQVGHNASHSFALGLLPDGRFVKRSVGEGSEWDEELGCPKIEAKIYIRSDVGYLGHW